MPAIPIAISSAVAVVIVCSPDEVKARIDDLGDKGVTEIVFQPCGPDIRRELEAMFAVASG
jgi:hypothetical protein